MQDLRDTPSHLPHLQSDADISELTFSNSAGPQRASEIRVIQSKDTWIESSAHDQLKKVAELPGMKLVVGLPDLHPGRGRPIGMAAASTDRFFPELVGGDIGCGMTMTQTDIAKSKSTKIIKRSGKLTLEDTWDGDLTAWREQFGVRTHDYARSLGTIGAGNHFAELQTVAEIFDEQAFLKLGFEKKALQLLVHSGSRGYGQSVLDRYMEQASDVRNGAVSDTDAAKAYLSGHDDAVRWAAANRALIAKRFIDQTGGDHQTLLDLPHNFLEKTDIGGEDVWLHRKGAAPSNDRAVIIPGSREHHSYLVRPIGDTEISAHSLAHGAGRKWSRSSCRERLEKKNNAESLKKTKLGSTVICEDNNLIFEEAGAAYKDIESVIHALEEHGLIQVIATFQPVLTYKVGKAG